jgi:hypothetical protein
MMPGFLEAGGKRTDTVSKAGSDYVNLIPTSLIFK